MPFPSGPSYTAYANYVIYFADQAEYDMAVFQAGGIMMNISPADAAALFDIPWPYVGGGALDPVKGMYTVSYSLTEPGSEIGHPLPSGVFLSPSSPGVIVPGQAGAPATLFPAGPSMHLIWSAMIFGSAGAQEDGDPIVGNMVQRRWATGFEFPGNAEGGSNTGLSLSRDASRVGDGIGFAVRCEANIFSLHVVTEFSGGANVPRTWERFYIRLRKTDSVPIVIWRSSNNPSAGSGVLLGFTGIGGELAIYNITSIGTVTLLGTSANLTIGEWSVIEINLTQNTAPTGGSGTVEVFVNHQSAGSFAVLPAAGGLGENSSTHQSSSLGVIGSPANLWEFDLDDWICGEPIPAGETLDTLTGSHIRGLFIDGFGVLNSGWAGQFDSMNQMINPSQASSNSRFTSIIPNAHLDGVTNADNEQNGTGLTVGVQAATISAYGQHSGTQDSQLGYSVGIGAPVLATVNLSIASEKVVMYRPGGVPMPGDIVPFGVHFVKSSGVDSCFVNGLQAAVEQVGIYGIVDDPAGNPYPPIIHNSRYPNTPWSFSGPLPDGPVSAEAGTYTGNDTFQAIELSTPCHFLWIRAVGSALAPIVWFGAGLGGHFGTNITVAPELPVRVYTSSIDGLTYFRVVGNGTNINASGTTYEWVAFCDPGMRFNLCGAYNENHLKIAAIHNLIDAGFLAEGGFLQNEYLGASAALGLLYKGPGFLGTTGNLLSGGALTELGDFATGIVNTGLDGHFQTSDQVDYSLWRCADINSGAVMVQIYSYVGNGVSPRVIPSTPISERYPLFALVVPHGASPSIFRDPSHTGTQSTGVNGTLDASNGIRAGGIDTITVGSNLNVNGTVYDVFIIPGFDDGWHNGRAYPPNGPSTPGPFPIPPIVPAEIAVVGSGGIVFSGETASLMLKDKSGIYTLIKNKTDDTLYDRQTGQTNVDVKIPNPTAKTGYIGG